MIFSKKQKNETLAQEELTFGKQALIFIWEIIKVVAISLAIIIPVRYYLIKPFYVIGSSMEPNFENHEYLIIDEISYRFLAPQRGDTVVVRNPFKSGEYFIKRTIGLPGEKVRITGGNVYIYNEKFPDGEKLIEPYLDSELKTLGEIEVLLKEDEYYILGDNRMASMDSRVFGPIKKTGIIGRTLFRGFPLNRFGLVNEKVDYNF